MTTFYFDQDYKKFDEDRTFEKMFLWNMSKALKGDRRAKAQLIGELGEREFDYQPSDNGTHLSDLEQ